MGDAIQIWMLTMRLHIHRFVAAVQVKLLGVAIGWSQYYHSKCNVNTAGLGLVCGLVEIAIGPFSREAGLIIFLAGAVRQTRIDTPAPEPQRRPMAPRATGRPPPMMSRPALSAVQQQHRHSYAHGHLLK